jgi:hypothetical protein
VRYVAGHALASIDPANRFDYLAPPAQRTAAGDAILKRWLERAGAVDRAAIDTRIQALVQKRDDTPVQAME